MYTRRSPEAEIVIAETLETPAFETLPDDIFNLIGRFCVPKFGFILASKQVYARSRCDKKNGFLFDVSTLMHLIDARRDITRQVGSMLQSFTSAPDDIFLHLYLQLEKVCRYDVSTWDANIRSQHLLRLLRCPTFEVKQCLHPRQTVVVVKADDGDDEILKYLFMDILSSDKITNESCADRIGYIYPKMRLCDNSKPVANMRFAMSLYDNDFFGASFLRAYLELPRSEKVDARARLVFLRIYYPSSIDYLAHSAPPRIVSCFAILALHLFGDDAWSRFFQLGRMPMRIRHWHLMLPDEENWSVAHQLLGREGIFLLLDKWLRRMFDIVIAADSPYRFLSIEGIGDPNSDYSEDPHDQQVIDLVVNIISMGHERPLGLPWAKLFLWMRRHWDAWSLLKTTTQVKFIYLAAKEHFLSGFFTVDLTTHNGLDTREACEWICEMTPKLGHPLPDYYIHFFLFTRLHADSRMFGHYFDDCIKNICSVRDTSASLLNILQESRISSSFQLRELVRESEKDYAQLLVEEGEPSVN